MWRQLPLGLVLSFYSGAWYQKVAASRLRYLFTYLLLLVLISSVLVIVRFGINLSVQVGSLQQEIIQQLPPMQIDSGVLKTPAKKQYLIYVNQHKTLVGIIEASRNVNNLQSSLFFLGKTAFYYRLSGTKYGIHYPQKTIRLTHEKIKEIVAPYVHLLLLTSIVIFFIVQSLFLFSVVLLFAWAMSMLAKSIAKSFGYVLSIRAARNIAICALTPPLLLGSICYLFLILTPAVFVGLVFLACAYLVWAVNVCKKKGKMV